MKKKKKKKKFKGFKPEREVKTELKLTGQTKAKTETELFWNLKGNLKIKDLARITGKSERTIRSYYKYLSGQSLNKNDRKPPKEFLQSIKPLVKHYNKGKKQSERIRQKKSTTVKVFNKQVHVKQFSTEADERKLQKQISEQGEKFSYVVCRIGIRFYKRHGENFERYVSQVIFSKKAKDIFKQITDYINTLLVFDSILYAEIFEMNFQTVGKL